MYVEAKTPSAEIDILVSYTYMLCQADFKVFLDEFSVCSFGYKFLHLVSNNLWAAILTVRVWPNISCVLVERLVFFSLFFNLESRQYLSPQSFRQLMIKVSSSVTISFQTTTKLHFFPSCENQTEREREIER